MVKKNRVYFKLSNIVGLPDLSEVEIVKVLRAADEIISLGGRSLLSKILKGSKDRIIFEKNLDKCPVYGDFSAYTIEEITQKIDWMIINNYFVISYNYRLPVITFSNKGWETYKPYYRDEIYEVMIHIKQNNFHSVIERLKKTNRQVVEMLLQKISDSNDTRLFDLLVEWEKTEVKKVRELITLTINHLKEYKQ